MLSESDTMIIIEDQSILGRLLTDVIYYCHHKDTQETEADWLGLGYLWRDRDKRKGVEVCREHMKRCSVCGSRLKDIIIQLKKLY